MSAVKVDAKSKRSIWPQTPIGRVVLVRIVYFLIGYGTGLVGTFIPGQFQFPLRLAAWVLSGFTFATHLGHEHFRLRTPTVKTALRVAVAVASGAFLLAIGATAHAFLVQSSAPYWQFLLALVLWPLITAVPAFVVALVAAAVLPVFQRRA